MYFLLHNAKRLTRLTCWVVLCSFLGSLAAPALQAAPAVSSSKADLELVGGTEEAVTSSSESGDIAAVAELAEVDSTEDPSGALASDQLYYQTPKTDTMELKRTLGTVVGGLLLGVLGFSFGWVGLAIGAALGAGLGYLISSQVFPNRASVDAYNSNLTDPFYDSRYGTGSNYVPAQGGFTAPEGTSLRDLEQTYFDALTEYRQSLRGQDRTRTGDARVAYQDAYEALIRAKASAQ